MNIIEEHAKTYKAYEDMAHILKTRARIKSEASYEYNQEYQNTKIQDGIIHDISFSEEFIWLEFRHHSRNGLDDQYIELTLEELEMSDADYLNHIESKYAHIKRARQSRMRIQLQEQERTEKEMLRRLQMKYGSDVVSK